MLRPNWRARIANTAPLYLSPNAGPVKNKGSIPDSKMEVAGLIFAVVPLCLQGLCALDDGSRKMINYRRSVGDVVRQLEVEKWKLENTFGKLLGGIVTPQELATLLNGNGWDDNIRRKLSIHLGDMALKILESHMQTLCSIVRELGDELGLDENLQVCQNSCEFFIPALLLTYSCSLHY